MHCARYVLTIAAAATLSGCGLKDSWDETKRRADTVHTALAAGKGEAIWAVTTERFRRNGPKDRFLAFVGEVPANLGALKEARQTNWNSQTNNGETKVEMAFELTFERGTAHEELLWRWVDDSRFALDGFRLEAGDRSIEMAPARIQ